MENFYPRRCGKEEVTFGGPGLWHTQNNRPQTKKMERDAASQRDAIAHRHRVRKAFREAHCIRTAAAKLRPFRFASRHVRAQSRRHTISRACAPLRF